MDTFDPYRQWLGIPVSEQPPNHYRLLGIPVFEDSPTVIENAADQRMGHLRTFLMGKHAAEAQRLLGKVVTARLCLLQAEKKAAYDLQLRKTLQQRPQILPPPPPPSIARSPAGAVMQETASFHPKLHSYGPGKGAATAMADLPQLGEYQLLERLGGGGMGTVYKALHTKLGRHVAIKVLLKGRLEDEKAIARFEREMKAVGGMDHPNVVRATDAREVAGTRFLVMELLDGLDLEQIVRRCGPLPVADACEIVRQASLGLQCAFEHSLVHRDIKPSNLMLTSSAR